MIVNDDGVGPIIAAALSQLDFPISMINHKASIGLVGCFNHWYHAGDEECGSLCFVGLMPCLIFLMIASGDVIFNAGLHMYHE